MERVLEVPEQEPSIICIEENGIRRYFEIKRDGTMREVLQGELFSNQEDY